MQRSAVFFGFLFAFTATGAFASAITGVSSASALHSNDSVSWAQLGPNYTNVAGPAAWTSAQGNTGTVSLAPNNGAFQMLSQGDGWDGNFNPGESVVYNNDDGESIVVKLSQGAYGVGAHIQADNYGWFVANIAGYDAAGHLLGKYSELGNSTAVGDGSAVYIGLLSSSADIAWVEFSVTTPAQLNYLGIGSLSLNTDTPNAAAVTPEPASALLLGSGLLSAAALLRRRRAGKGE